MMAEWEKVLYKRQPFPDNYTPSSFLDEVVLNALVKERHYWKVVAASGAILQQICTVCITVAVSFHLYQGTLQFHHMGVVCMMVLILSNPF